MDQSVQSPISAQEFPEVYPAISSPSPEPKHSHTLTYILFLIVGIIFGSLATWGYQKFFVQPVDVLQPAPLPTVTETPMPLFTPTATTSTPIIDPTAGWSTFNITPDSAAGVIDYQIKLPLGWNRIEHSSNFQNDEDFRDNERYGLNIHQEENINPSTKQPFTSLRELSGLPYDTPAIKVGGQNAIQVLPRAGSENSFKVLFFSPTSKQWFSIQLDTPVDGSLLQEGGTLYFRILSTFKFL